MRYIIDEKSDGAIVYFEGEEYLVLKWKTKLFSRKGFTRQFFLQGRLILETRSAIFFGNEILITYQSEELPTDISFTRKLKGDQISYNNGRNIIYIKKHFFKPDEFYRNEEFIGKMKRVPVSYWGVYNYCLEFDSPGPHCFYSLLLFLLFLPSKNTD